MPDEQKASTAKLSSEQIAKRRLWTEYVILFLVVCGLTLLFKPIIIRFLTPSKSSIYCGDRGHPMTPGCLIDQPQMKPEPQ
jgi:hypothetical protein